MKAMTYRGPYKVQTENKEDPYIQHPNDAIVRVELAAICGSDLHLYHGLMPDGLLALDVSRVLQRSLVHHGLPTHLDMKSHLRGSTRVARSSSGALVSNTTGGGRDCGDWCIDAVVAWP